MESSVAESSSICELGKFSVLFEIHAIFDNTTIM